MTATVPIHIDRVVSDGVVVLHYGGATRSDRFALWTKAKARRVTTCCVSGHPIQPGDEIFRLWLPLSPPPTSAIPNRSRRGIRTTGGSGSSPR